MRQQREHNRRVIADCAERPPRSFWIDAGLGIGGGLACFLLRRGGPAFVIAGAAALVFFWLLAGRVLPNPRSVRNDPFLRALLDHPEHIVAITHSRDWWTDTFRIIAADGADLELASRGTLSRRLAVSLAAHCSRADISTPWVSRSHPRRPSPAPVPGGLPFA